MPSLSRLVNCRSGKGVSRLFVLSLAFAVAAPTLFAQDGITLASAEAASQKI